MKGQNALFFSNISFKLFTIVYETRDNNIVVVCIRNETNIIKIIRKGIFS